MSGGFQVIPAFTFGPGQATADRATVNGAATPVAEQQLTLAAIDAPLRYFFGRVRIGGLIAVAISYGTDLLLLCVHGRGPIEAVDSVEFDNAPAPAGVQSTHYLGAAGQGVDPWLAAAFALQGKVYTDALPGIAYSVLRIPPAIEAAFDGIAFVCRGLKVYDPRTSTTVYSDNPALVLGWFVSNAVEGRGETADWASLETCADLNDALVGGAKRRTVGLVVNDVGDLDRWEAVIAQYAGCWPVREGDTVYFVPDAPTASTFSFTKSKHKIDSLEIDVRNRARAPTVVTVRWTNTAVTPWASASVTVKIDGVDAGTVPYQESVIDMPGIQLPGHALREAYRRLYEAQLADVSVKFTAMDEGLKLRRYQVFDYTDDAGFNAKPFRLLDASIVEPGRWRISAIEYQAEVHSDATAVAPGIGDTDLPNPSSVAAPGGLAVVETVYLEKAVAADSLGRGLIYQSRFDASWAASAHAYPVTYRVQFLDGSQVIHEGQTTGLTYASPPVQQGKAYGVKVFARNSLGFESTPAEASLTALGKLLPPGPVPAITAAFEVGGEVILGWDPAVDIDVMRYEWRYGPTSGFSWSTATLIDRVDGLRARFLGLPVGTWRFAVKAIDSVGNYSADATTVDIVITQDTDAFLQEREFTSPTLTNMVELPPLEGVWKRRWATRVATDAWNSVMPNPVNSGSNPVISYHASATSQWVGESWDLGSAISGDWALVSNAVAVSGTILVGIETSPDGSTWTFQPGSVWNGSARFVRPVLQALTTSTLLVTAPPKIAFSAQARTETGVVTTLTSGGKLVELAGRYASVDDLQATAVNATASRSVVADRILVHPEAGLVHSWDYNGSGNNYTYQDISHHGRAIVSGDHLEYDVFIDTSSPAPSTFAQGGLYLRFSDLTDTSALTADDGYSMYAPATGFEALARGQWVSRKASLAAFVGKTTDRWVLTQNGDAVSGTAKIVYRNIRVTDGAGTTRATVWSSGEPSQNSDFLSALVANVRCGPANSFLLYAFNATPAQVAQEVRYAFKGF